MPDRSHDTFAVAAEQLSPDSLHGRVALVTGAAGGIGAATARRLAGAGVRLVLADRNGERLVPLVEELSGSEILGWSGDLSQEAEVKALFGELLERFGRMDVAVNAAGILRATPFEEISVDEWDRMMAVNARSVFLVCRECCEPMRRQGWGRIVNLASLAAQTGGILAGAHYSASKAAVVSITRSVAKLMAPCGVRCNAIAPSGVETEMLLEFTPEQRETLRKGVPVGRFARPEEVAELAFWLASPASDYVTGQTISINGGVYLGG